MRPIKVIKAADIDQPQPQPILDRPSDAEKLRRAWLAEVEASRRNRERQLAIDTRAFFG